MPPKGKLLQNSAEFEKQSGANGTRPLWKALREQQKVKVSEFTSGERMCRAVSWVGYHFVAVFAFALAKVFALLWWSLCFMPQVVERTSVIFLNFALPVVDKKPSRRKEAALCESEWDGVVNTHTDRLIKASVNPALELSKLGCLDRNYDQIYKQTMTNARGVTTVGTDPVFGPRECYDGPILGGDLSTLLSSQKPNLPNPYYRETISSNHDGATLCLDWMFARERKKKNMKNDDEVEAKGIIAIVPGMGSSSHSPYIELAVAAFTQAGWHCVVFNTRGMGTTPLDKCFISHAGFTADIRSCFVDGLDPVRLEQDLGLDPLLPLMALGFSLGGGMLTRMLAEEDQTSGDANTLLSQRILAAASVSSPWDYHSASETLLKPKQHLIYQQHLCGGLRHFADRHVEVLSKSPTCDFRGLTSSPKTLPTLQDFDEHITAPMAGYRSRSDYYTGTAALPSLSKVATRMMVLVARDDPITGPPPSDPQWERIIAGNPLVCLVQFPSGGHLGFPVHLTESLMDTRSLLCDGEKEVTANAMENTVLRFFERHL